MANFVETELIGKLKYQEKFNGSDPDHYRQWAFQIRNCLLMYDATDYIDRDLPNNATDAMKTNNHVIYTFIVSNLRGAAQDVVNNNTCRLSARNTWKALEGKFLNVNETTIYNLLRELGRIKKKSEIRHRIRTAY